MAFDYTTLITSEHRDKPLFTATVGLLTQAVSSIGDASTSLTTAFSLDAAVGVQLDAVGLWVGISRIQNVPIPDSYFTWGTAGLGWGEANWRGPFAATEGVTVLDDDTYRAVIRAKIGSNYWDGTNEQQNLIGQSVFADFGVHCFVVDNMDMTTTIYIIGSPTVVLLEMIKRGVAPPKAAGVRVTGYILASMTGAPFFALDVSTTTLVAGLDFGSFG